jgi:phosphoenolpyruvate phosphomutase
MKAIILASGIGKRLQPLTNDIPKPMIKLNKKTIIERQIDSFLKNKIKDIVITTGPYEEKFQYFLMQKYNNLKIKFVYNPQYDTTNYIYSLWLTKDHIDDDIILIHGDLVFEEKLLEKIVECKDNVVLVNKQIDKHNKDFKAVIENEKVTKIGVNYLSKNAYSSIPFYKFSKKDFIIWIDAIEDEVKNGNLDIYAEDALNKISDEITLKPLYFKDETCMEIDTMRDLENAKKLIK